MTKKQLIELWNSLDDETEIVFPYGYSEENGKIKKIVIITDCHTYETGRENIIA